MQGSLSQIIAMFLKNTKFSICSLQDFAASAIWHVAWHMHDLVEASNKALFAAEQIAVNCFSAKNKNA